MLAMTERHSRIPRGSFVGTSVRGVLFLSLCLPALGSDTPVSREAADGRLGQVKDTSVPQLPAGGCLQVHNDKRFLVQPISFSIPAELVRANVTWTSKSRTLAGTIPGQRDTYTHSTQEDFYEAYSTSLFGVTFKKAGWDCLRHYEIVAAGCVPYMLDAAGIPPGTMFAWPKELLQQVLSMKGVFHDKIQSIVRGQESAALSQSLTNALFDEQAYMDTLTAFQGHMVKHLTTSAMASYLLSFSPNKPSSILFVGSSQRHSQDYLAETIFHGLRSLYGKAVTDYPARTWMYKDSDIAQSSMYGKGYSYALMLENEDVDRSDVLDKIAARQYSHIVFAISHHGRHPFIDHVKASYLLQEVFFLDGSDTGGQETDDVFAEVCGQVGTCFRREMICASSIA